MVGAAVDLLAREMSETFHDMRSRLAGLTEAEFFWEPVPGAWTVFRREDGRWDYPYEEPDPDPAPVTTIAWRLAHVAMCKVMYHEYAFGPGRLTWQRAARFGQRLRRHLHVHDRLRRQLKPQL